MNEHTAATSEESQASQGGSCSDSVRTEFGLDGVDAGDQQGRGNEGGADSETRRK